MENSETRMIGIDPGSHRVGYSILEKKERNKISLLTYGTIDIQPGTKSPENLIVIRKTLSRLLDEYTPGLASVEELFFSKNQKTAGRVYESRGCILLTLAESGVRIIEPSVTQIKKGTTGNGTADKKQVRQALKLILGLDDLSGHDDSWDAVAAGFVGFAMASDIRVR
ncbi:MAG: crossover junction endodeoxyribonuclease RuvC [Leptospira sp.]|nr:crossover junction endodeoxyribonuclease RuvC [Leptospira sp.]